MFQNTRKSCRTSSHRTVSFISNQSSFLDKIEFESEETKKQAVGNLVADDEWMGVSMELGEVVRMAVLEDLKKNARDFLGKEEYKLGDISKQVDTRVKEEIANLRGKDECEFFHGIKIVSGARLL